MDEILKILKDIQQKVDTLYDFYNLDEECGAVDNENNIEEIEADDEDDAEETDEDTSDDSDEDTEEDDASYDWNDESNEENEDAEEKSNTFTSSVSMSSQHD